MVGVLTSPMVVTLRGLVVGCGDEAAYFWPVLLRDLWPHRPASPSLYLAQCLAQHEADYLWLIPRLHMITHTAVLDPWNSGGF